MRALVFNRKLKFAKHLEELVKQDFRNVHRIVSESGQVSYKAGRDENGHSDATSALVLAIQAQKHNPDSVQLPQAQAIRSVFGFGPLGTSSFSRL